VRTDGRVLKELGEWLLDGGANINEPTFSLKDKEFNE
jgi:hypothetical protein